MIFYFDLGCVLQLEKILTLMSRLPDDSVFAATLQQFIIDIRGFRFYYVASLLLILLFIDTPSVSTVYKDLPHPPSSYLALPTPATSVVPAKVKYAFRSADGSNYNILFPAMGQANSPYARSVPSTNFVPASTLPDPGLVFDTLLRRDKFRPHPGGLSSLFFAFADLIIHSVFNTKYPDSTINLVSSYLDLSILYGSSDQDVNSVRRKDGTGKLWDDVFADSRLLGMPPSVCALLILFNRNHNVSISSTTSTAVLTSFEFFSMSHKRSSISMNGVLSKILPRRTKRNAWLKTMRFFIVHAS